jgi:hypothetical protein
VKLISPIEISERTEEVKDRTCSRVELKVKHGELSIEYPGRARQRESFDVWQQTTLWRVS